MIRLTPPTRSGYVSSAWGADRSYRGGWHAGLDFPDKNGAPMLAAANGVVSFVKNYSNSFAGKYIVIDHGDGISTRYLHAKKIFVKVGDRVKRGQIIGEVGATGTMSGRPHVHFDTKLKERALQEYIKRYGTPTTGFSKKMSWGQGVPTETFMDRADYKPSALQASLKRGVKFYRPEPPRIIGAIVVIGFGWALYSYLTRFQRK